MIQAPVTTNKVETTSRQKQCHLLSCLERLRLFTQPMIPPTRKARATTTVTQAEAIIGKIRARTPSTSNRMPSATVKLRRAPTAKPELSSEAMKCSAGTRTPGT